MFRNGFGSCTFQSIFSQLGKGMVRLMRVELMILKFGVFFFFVMMTDTRERFVYKRVETDTA